MSREYLRVPILFFDLFDSEAFASDMEISQAHWKHDMQEQKSVYCLPGIELTLL